MYKSIVTLAGLAVFAGIANANILLNPGFESGVLTPWAQTADFGGPENWNVTTADAFTGTRSATSVGNKLIEQNFAATPTSDILSVTFALKNVDATVNAVFFRYSDSTTAEFLISHTNGNWNVYDWTSNLAPGKSLVGFGVYGVSGGATGRTYLDDAKITVVPEPATIAVLGAGLLALARRRRKG